MGFALLVAVNAISGRDAVSRSICPAALRGALRDETAQMDHVHE